MKYLDEIEARANAATEGPWKASSLTPGGPDRIEASDGEVLAYDVAFQVSDDSGNDNAEFIAHARESVPALVAALRAVVAVHRPVTVPGEVFGTWGEAKQCEDCEQRWPCNTLDTIRWHLGEDA